MRELTTEEVKHVSGGHDKVCTKHILKQPGGVDAEIELCSPVPKHKHPPQA